VGHGYEAVNAKGEVTFVRSDEEEIAWWEYKGSGIKANVLTSKKMQDFAHCRPLMFPHLAAGEEAPKILTAPVFYRTENGVERQFEGKYVLHWSDTGEPTAVTGLEEFKQGHQPEEILGALHDAAIKEGLKVVSMGICDNRRKFFVNARMDTKLIDVTGHSSLAPIVTFASGVDMKTSTKADINAWSTVCANLYAAFMAKGDTEYCYKRSHRQEFDRNEAFLALDVADFEKQWDDAREMLTRYAGIPLSNLNAERMFRELINPGYASEVLAGEGTTGVLDVENIVVAQDADNVGDFATLLQKGVILNTETRIKLDRRVPRGFVPYMDAYHGVNGEAGAKPGDLFGFLQGVTYNADHGAVGSKTSGKKMASGWFGGGVKRKQNAYELAETAATALGG